MKKKSAQHKIEREKKFKDILCFGFMILGGLIFMTLGIDYAFEMKNWETAEVKEIYSQEYIIREDRPFRMTICSFQLENGLRFSIPITLMQNHQQLVDAFENSTPIPLVFRFLTDYSPFPGEEVAIISITSLDGIIYLDESMLYQELAGTSGVCFMVSLCLFLPFLIIVPLWYIAKGKDTIRKKRKAIRRRISKFRSKINHNSKLKF